MTEGRKITIGILLLSIIAGAYFLFSTSRRANKMGTGFQAIQLSASKDHYAFIHKKSDREHVVVVVDNRTKDFKIYGAASEMVLLAPGFLPDGRLRITVAPRVNPPFSSAGLSSAQYVCDPSAVSCERSFSFSGGISYAVPSSEGGFVFVGAELVEMADPAAPSKARLAYGNFDFYLSTPDHGHHRLTESRAHELTSVSYGDRLVVFQLFKRKEPGKGPRPSSEIYCARLDENNVPVDFDADTAKLCISYGKRKDLRPSISRNGKYIAFLSASASRGSRWIYEIAAMEFGSKLHVKSIAPQGDDVMSLSPPIFVGDDTLRYIERVEEEYHLKSYDISTDEISLNFKLPFSKLSKAPDLILGQQGQ